MLASLVCLSIVTLGQGITSCQGHPDGCSTVADSGTTTSQSLLQRKSNVLNKITGVEKEADGTSQAGGVMNNPSAGAGVTDAPSKDARATHTTPPGTAVEDVPSEGASSANTTPPGTAVKDAPSEGAGAADTTGAAGTGIFENNDDPSEGASAASTSPPGTAVTDAPSEGAGAADTTGAAGTGIFENNDDPSEGASAASTTPPGTAVTDAPSEGAGAADTKGAAGTGIFENNDDPSEGASAASTTPSGTAVTDAPSEGAGATDTTGATVTGIFENSDDDDDDDGQADEGGDGKEHDEEQDDDEEGDDKDDGEEDVLVDDPAQQFQEDVKKDAEKFVKAITENKAGGGVEGGEESNPSMSAKASATEKMMNYLCIDEGKSFTNAVAAAKYFQDECLHVYEYNATLCNGLSDKVFEKWHEDMSAPWKPDTDVCNEVDSLLRADTARRHEMGLAVVVASLPTAAPTATLLERAERSSSASASSTLDEVMRWKPSSPAPP